jgi:hypothetical protein
MGSSTVDAFAAPATQRPSHTWWTLWSMGSTVTVGSHPAHRLEVVTHHWTGHEHYLVDGVVVGRDRNLGWHADRSFAVGRHEVRLATRWYPLLPVELYVDGALQVDDLFPQLAWLKVLGGLPVLAVALTFAGSIAFDLWRLWGLAAAG